LVLHEGRHAGILLANERGLVSEVLHVPQLNLVEVLHSLLVPRELYLQLVRHQRQTLLVTAVGSNLYLIVIILEVDERRTIPEWSGNILGTHPDAQLAMTGLELTTRPSLRLLVALRVKLHVL